MSHHHMVYFSEWSRILLCPAAHSLYCSKFKTFNMKHKSFEMTSSCRFRLPGTPDDSGRMPSGSLIVSPSTSRTNLPNEYTSLCCVTRWCCYNRILRRPSIIRFNESLHLCWRESTGKLDGVARSTSAENIWREMSCMHCLSVSNTLLHTYNNFAAFELH